MLENILKKDDYQEPCCPLSKPGQVQSVPMRRIIEKLDEYLEQKEFDAAERHLKYWLQEAEWGGDERGKLSLLNEQIGLYRKCEKKEEALFCVEEALKQAKNLGLEESVTMGTTLVNAATACRAFDEIERAQQLYREARALYEGNLDSMDVRLGGLYNNMALTVMAQVLNTSASMTVFRRITIMSLVFVFFFPVKKW